MDKEDAVSLGEAWLSGKVAVGAKEIGVGSDYFGYRVILIADHEWYPVQCQNRGDTKRVEAELHEYISSLTVPISTK